MRTSLDGGRALSGGRPRSGAGLPRRAGTAAALLAAALLLTGVVGCGKHDGGAASGSAAPGQSAQTVARTTRAASASALPSATGTPGHRHQHRRPAGPPQGGGSPYGQGGSLDATAQQLAPYLERHFGTAFAAVLVDDPHDQLVVYRLPDPRLDSAARALAGPTRLAFVTARYSFLRQTQLLARIGRDLGYWRSHGIVINSRGTTNGVHCAVIVTTGTGGAQQQRAFDRRYGTGLVKVVEGDLIVYK